MPRAICIDDSKTDMLEKGKEYYVFPLGPRALYVSRFDTPKAHFMACLRDRFKMIEEEPAEYWKARVVAAKPWWRLGKEYIIGPSQQPERVMVYPLSCGTVVFTDTADSYEKIEPCEKPDSKFSHIRALERPKAAPSTKTPGMDQTPENGQEMKRKQPKKKKDTVKIVVKEKKAAAKPKEQRLEDLGQMTLDDFLEF